MNLIKFPVSTTNIFPLANSVAGGQLLSEWNIRSREMVGTSSSVKYDIGPSFAHSEDDFKLTLQSDGVISSISTSEIVIQPGKAIVNGHFIQSLAPISIDMLERNTWLQQHNQAPLTGTIGVGLKAFYSTESTMAGTMQVENGDDMYAGIQVILLPANQLTTPDEDITTQTTEGSATCDLKLGTFEFTNGAVANIFNDPRKLQYVGSDRIRDIKRGLSDTYITKTGLNPKYLYVFSGKSSSTTFDTWCVANDSLFVWDTNPRTTTDASQATYTYGARFTQSADGEAVQLILPHKQVDGMQDGQGRPEYYADKILSLPAASYADNTPGIVTKTYTKNIKNLESKLSNIYQLVKGKQVGYFDTLAAISDLPPINANWEIGDYVLVAQDSTTGAELNDLSMPSTLYAIVPGYVQGLTFFGKGDLDSDVVPAGLKGIELESAEVTSIPVEEISVADSLGTNILDYTPVASNSVILILSSTVAHTITKSDLIDAETGEESTSFTVSHSDYAIQPSERNYVELLSTNSNFNVQYRNKTQDAIAWDTANNSITFNRLQSTGTELKSWAECGIYEGDTIVMVVDNRNYPTSAHTAMQTLTPNGQYNPSTGEIFSTRINGFTAEISPRAMYSYYKMTAELFSDYTSFRGVPGEDYFVATYTYVDDNDVSHYQKYYFVVSQAYPREWSEPIQLTGSVPFAQENIVGGFYNVTEDTNYTDRGYVYLDSSGHLRLRDYSLLRAGTLAYQLGESIDEFGEGESLSSIQDTLDEYINDRIAFMSNDAREATDTPNVIEITIHLSDDAPESDEDDGYRNLYIRNIDSRFNTSVYFHFTGDATNKTIINFVDCERIRIDNNICGSALGNGTAGPVINLYRCGLYYDPYVMNYIATCSRPTTSYSYYDFESAEVMVSENGYPSWFTGMKDINLWYQRYTDTDPNLTVDDMTVRELDVAAESESIDFWTPLSPNDNHYATALSSVTFAGDGSIIGCGLLVANKSTENVTQNDTIVVSEFTLPSGEGLTYPASCMTRRLKVTGTFTTAYYTDAGWYVTETAFTAQTSTYDEYTSSQQIKGTIAFHEKTTVIQANVGSDMTEGGIPGWSDGSYNLFYGGIVSANS
jgi:hypothetical protein